MRYDLAAVHVANKFIWRRLVAAGIMDPSKYNGLIPIIPTQQIEVFNNMAAGTPFIVYTYSNVGYTEDIWEHTEQVTYRIYSDNERQIRQISHFLTDLLRRYDWTGQEINDFVIETTGDRLDSDDRRFYFNWSTVVSTVGPEPYTTEGGRQAGGVVVRYNYLHYEDNTTNGSLGMRS